MDVEKSFDMKQIPLLQGKALLIELPDGATNLKVLTVHQGSKSFPSLKYDRPDLVRGFIDLPPGNWRIIGMLSKVTDAELADVTGFYYNKYNERYVEMPTSAMRATPIGDIEDAIRAGGHLLKSPPAPKCGCTGPAEEGVCDACDEWMTAQSRVLSRERCLLLRRVG